MKKKRQKYVHKITSFFLVLVMMITMLPTYAWADTTQTQTLDFGVANPAGYVTVSFVDNGVRLEDANISDAEKYGTAVGTIIAPTQVPYEEGDNIADVTVRLLDAMGIPYESSGSVDNGFYLAGLKEIEINGTYYPTFSEFDAGSESGWCVRLNNWHLDQGTSAVTVEDEDVISWLYTCQLGADVGADFSTKSAEITSITFMDSDLALNPSFSTEQEAYEVTVAEDISSVAFDVALQNYASVVTVTVDDQEVKYRPNKAITVNKDSKIQISTKLDYMDAANNNQISTYTDTITIQLVTELAETNQAPTVNEGVPTTMNATAGEAFTVDLANFFTDADKDSLTYSVACEALSLNTTLEGSVFEGTIAEAGDYTVVITASDGQESVSHTVTVTVEAAVTNTPPNIKEAYAQTKAQTYVYGNSYVYIYMDDIFEDADGDALMYKATRNGEAYEVKYNSWSKEYYIMFDDQQPEYSVFKIVANDGTADSEEFTATCLNLKATIAAQEGAPLFSDGRNYYYVKGSAENDKIALNYTLNQKTDLVAPEWYVSNTSVVNHNDGTFLLVI